MIAQLNQNNHSCDHSYDKCMNELLDILLASKVQEERRLKVIRYMNELFAEVGLSSFLYGSVALGTYLPDGDIDVSVFCRPEQMPALDWTKLVKKALCSNSDRINGVTFINAQVKIYKCVIDDVSIDISGNQIGGLCTLCFLERMNQKFGKDDLLKKSIVLIKAWSYYEARILASHHGLLSTYAVTVLILFILNAYYDELDTPLQVLIKFFEYFSDFDWDRYGIGIQGEFLLDPPQKNNSSKKGDAPAHANENGGGKTQKLLCSDAFLKECVQKYGVTTNRSFQRKFFNILDPARADNNLGRSVSRSNFLRIKKVFKKGYKTLSEILNRNEPSEILSVFFKNSWKKNQRYDEAEGKNGKLSQNAFKNGVLSLDMKKRNLLFQRKLKDFESHLEVAKTHLRMVQGNTSFSQSLPFVSQNGHQKSMVGIPTDPHFVAIAANGSLVATNPHDFSPKKRPDKDKKRSKSRDAKWKKKGEGEGSKNRKKKHGKKKYPKRKSNRLESQHILSADEAPSGGYKVDFSDMLKSAKRVPRKSKKKAQAS